MSGQYPSGYNSPLGGHRGQFNPQQQTPQLMNPMNQMATSGMGQNTMPGGSGGAQGSGAGMLPMGGYHPQQQIPSGLAGMAGGLMNVQQQQQQQMPHQSMGAGGQVSGSSGGMMAVGGAASMNAGASNLLQQASQQQQMGAGMPMSQQQTHAPQQMQQAQSTSGGSSGLMHGQSNMQTPQGSSNMLAISQPNPHKEINIVALSRLGQETVQDITSRFQEIFAALKIIQPTANRDNNTEKKVQEYFRTIRLLFKRVRIIYEKCNDGYPQGMEYTHVESLIPYKDEPDHRIEPTQCDEYRKALQENQELIETVKLKNRQLREIIDRTRIIIWEINTMLSMRRS